MRVSVLFVLLAIGPALASAAPIQIASRVALGPNGELDWSSVLVNEGDASATPLAGIATNGVSISFSSSEGVTRLVQESSYFGGFASGESVLASTADIFNGPFASLYTIDFGSAVRGAGLSIEANNFGPFTAQLQVYTFGNILLDTFSIVGDSGSSAAPYLGTLAALTEITRMIYSITAYTDDPDFSGFFGFSINQLDVVAAETPTAVPEPATWSLLATGGVLIALRRRGKKRCRALE